MISGFARFTRRANRLFLALSGMIAAAMLLAMAYDLLARSVFGASSLWVIDVSRFMLVYIFFLALAPALESGAHVAVDVVEHYLPAPARRALRALALTLTLIFGAFLMWQVTRSTYQAFVEDRFFPTFIQVKLKFVYWIAPLGVAQFLLTALAELAQTLKGGEQWKV